MRRSQQGQESQGSVPGFLGSVLGAVFGNVGSGLSPSMPVGSGLDPNRATMFGPYGRLSSDLSGQCLNLSAVAGKALSGMAPPPGNLNRQFGGSSLDQNQTPQMATIGQIVQLVGSLDSNQMRTFQFLGERMSLLNCSRGSCRDHTATVDVKNS